VEILVQAIKYLRGSLETSQLHTQQLIVLQHQIHSKKKVRKIQWSLDMYVHMPSLILTGFVHTHIPSKPIEPLDHILRIPAHANTRTHSLPMTLNTATTNLRTQQRHSKKKKNYCVPAILATTNCTRKIK